MAVTLLFCVCTELIHRHGWSREHQVPSPRWDVWLPGTASSLELCLGPCTAPALPCDPGPLSPEDADPVRSGLAAPAPSLCPATLFEGLRLSPALYLYTHVSCLALFCLFASHIPSKRLKWVESPLCGCPVLSPSQYGPNWALPRLAPFPSHGFISVRNNAILPGIRAQNSFSLDVGLRDSLWNQPPHAQMQNCLLSETPFRAGPSCHLSFLLLYLCL